MSTLENQISDAIDNAKIRLLTTSDLAIRVNREIIYICHAMGTQSPSESYLDTLSGGLIEILQEDFTTLTFEEVRLALKMGTQGVFGSYYNPNLAVFRKWLSAYRCCDARKAVIESRGKKAGKSHLDARRALMMGLDDIEYAGKVFRAYRSGESLEKYSPVIVYEILTEKGKMVVTDEEWIAAYKKHEDVYLMGIRMDGEAGRGIARARTMRYLLERQFDRWIAEMAAKTVKVDIQPVQQVVNRA